MAHVKLNGHRTWYFVSDKRAPAVVLLHGGLSSSASLLGSIGPILERKFRIAAFDRRGHGKTADTDEDFHYETMADETIAFLEHVGRRSHLVGHSDGGIVALLVARRRPDLVRRIVVVGANFHHNGLVPSSPMPVEGPVFDEWVQRYAERSPDGAVHARAVVEKANRLFASEPTLTVDELAAITVPTLVMAGDDEVISLSHTCALYEAIPDAQLCVMPGTSHALLKERTKECSRLISHFLRSPWPVETFMPVRRRTTSP